MKYLLNIVLLSVSLAIRGIDVEAATTVQNLQCLKNSGYSFAYVRGFMPTGSVDPNAWTTLEHAKAAGLTADIIFFPCRGRGAGQQIAEMFANLPSSLFGMVWIAVENNLSQNCSWSGHDPESNCDYLGAMISAVKVRGKNPGIYSFAQSWVVAMGSRYACPGFENHRLWYGRGDSSESFNDFLPFGGWQKPAIKQTQSNII